MREPDLRKLESYLVDHPDDTEFAQRLTRTRRLIEENPLLDTHPLYQEQADFLDSWTRFTLFVGGNRSGKTLIGIVKDLIELLDEDFLPDHLKRYKRLDPPVRGRIVSPGRGTTVEVVIFEMLRSLIPKAAYAGGSWREAFDKQNNILRFRNGSWLQMLTAEMDVDKHAGAALDFVHFDEEPPGDKGYEIFRENTQRLLSTDGRFWMSFTPTAGFSWSFDSLYEKSHLDSVTVIHASMDKNPTISKEAKRELLRGMSKEELQARKEGRYVHFGGLVYPEFSETHLVDPPAREHVQKLDLVVGLDPGLTGTAVLWAGFDREDVALIFAELFLKDATPDVVVPLIKDVNTEWGINPDYYVMDPASARNRDLMNAEQLESAYAREGLFCMGGQNEREPGITQVKRRLQAEPPALLISRECQRLRWEMKRYRRNEKPDGSFDVIKKEDHAVDSLRYVVMERVWGVEPELRKKKRVPKFDPEYQPAFESEPVEALAGPMGSYS